MIEIEENSGLVTSKSYKIGIFLDYHNQEIGINELRYDQHFDYEQIAKYIHSLGIVEIARAYGNWNYYKKASKILRQNGFELIDTIRKKNKIKKKDNTDTIMTLDIVDIYHSQSDINLFIIISGDIDFLDAILKIKKRPKNKVIVISEKYSLNYQYRDKVDKVITYQLLKNLFEIK